MSARGQATPSGIAGILVMRNSSTAAAIRRVAVDGASRGHSDRPQSRGARVGAGLVQSADFRRGRVALQDVTPTARGGDREGLQPLLRLRVESRRGVRRKACRAAERRVGWIDVQKVVAVGERLNRFERSPDQRQDAGSRAPPPRLAACRRSMIGGRLYRPGGTLNPPLAFTRKRPLNPVRFR